MKTAKRIAYLAAWFLTIALALLAGGGGFMLVDAMLEGPEDLDDKEESR